MISGKDRARLKAMAHGMNSSVQVGKDGLTKEILEQVDKQLEYKELVKISVLDNSPVYVSEIRQDILDYTSSDFVQEIGSKLVIYRESKDHKKIFL